MSPMCESQWLTRFSQTERASIRSRISQIEIASTTKWLQMQSPRLAYSPTLGRERNLSLPQRGCRVTHKLNIVCANIALTIPRQLQPFQGWGITSTYTQGRLRQPWA